MLVFMFQATQIYYEYIAWIDRNDYIPDQVVSGASAWEPETLNVSDPYLDAQYILFFGDAQGPVGHTVSQWCTYTKRTLVAYDNLSQFPGSIGKNQECVSAWTRRERKDFACRSDAVSFKGYRKTW